MIDLAAYRNSPSEKQRVADLLRALPRGSTTVLEIGAREGYITRLLTSHYDNVVALDLSKPIFEIDGVLPVAGDVRQLQFTDNSFDVVLCSEVLEHVPTSDLSTACGEIRRVSRHEAIIGVPFEQDMRIGRCTCSACNEKVPRWGHVNSFTLKRLQDLFAGMDLVSTTYVGQTKEATNWLAVMLMDLGGNPWGTYEQEEPCTHCGAALKRPVSRSTPHRICSATATSLNRMQTAVTAAKPNWIHAVFRKRV